MNRRKKGASPVGFLMVQLLVGVLLLTPIEAKNSLAIVALGISFLGLFLAVFSASKSPDAKNKKILAGIFTLSLLTIIGITLTGFAQLVTTNMP
ncbi:hypothetical protein QNK01_01755 [Desemzia incerta]|uniref:hypothetical protein n=1 Tax=Desemzia incerta TaxID=82801 RepID=UPI0024C28D08|nr:hypothetical protein [Desemzia incerta]WHZ32390.1 hypothetical protein QNK01_01755 [Desemzia incerta]